ncbi:MAG: ribosomal-processing cysteine protease Prp [Spirochaetota bacterium]
MITVSLSGCERGEILRVLPGAGAVSLRADGHSGYSERGSDIVCAGVSAVIQASAAMMAGRQIEMTVGRDSGFFDITVSLSRLDDERKTIVEHALETAVCGVELIAKSYPDNVTITFEI